MNDAAHPRLAMRNLGRLRPDVAVPQYDRAHLKTGIVHFGPGVFFRAHIAWHIHRLLARDARWGIAAVSLRSGALAEAMRAQDGLYTLAELSVPPRFEIIGCITAYLTATNSSEAVFAQLTAPRVKLVTLTVTEKGYCLDGSGTLDLAHPDIEYDLAGPATPRSILGWLTGGLARRHAAGLQPFAVVSCDNLAGNGPKLRRAVIRFAKARGLDDLAAWIADVVRFPATMVDSITPFTDDALKARVAEATGLQDEAPVQREHFTQWVIEDILGPDAPDLASVGAILTDDVAVYEHAKLRLLNGVHSALAYLGIAAGHETTADAMADPRLAEFGERLMRENLAATLQSSPALDVQLYIGEILDRLRNPAVQHGLYKIAADGSQKLLYRFIEPISEVIQTGRKIERLAVPLAAWMRFVVAETRAGRALEDPLAEKLAQIGLACTGNAAADVPRFMALRAMFSQSLATDPRFTEAVSSAYTRLASGLAELDD